MAALTQRLAHALKTGAAEKTRRRDEGDDAAATARLLPWQFLEHLAGRPAPEIDVEIAQVLGVNPQPPRLRGLPIVQRRISTLDAAFAFHPTAQALGFVLVRRVADDDRDGLLPFDAIGGFALLPDRGGEAWESAAVVIRVSQGVRHIHVGRVTWRRTRERLHLRQHAELSFRNGRFYLRDESTNGSYIISEDGARKHLRREEDVLLPLEPVKDTGSTWSELEIFTNCALFEFPKGSSFRISISFASDISGIEVILPAPVSSSFFLHENMVTTKIKAIIFVLIFISYF